MIRKLLLIGESGLLQFYLSQDKIQIDRDLLSGFCKAIHSISLELTNPLKNIDFENQTMIVESIDHGDRLLLLAVLFDEYHIDEAIKNKMSTIYDVFFKQVEFGDETARIQDDRLETRIKNILNDVDLKRLITGKLDRIKSVLDPVIEAPDNEIDSYCLCSSMNNILYTNCNEKKATELGEASLMDVVCEYLKTWKMGSTPQGDKFIGWELPTGIDLANFVKTGQKTIGVVINTSINLKQEPNNEVLLYFFGKNSLMRSCVPNIEETLRTEIFRIDPFDEDPFYSNP